jgi:flagellin
MIINNNIAALNTHRQMGQVSGNASNSMEKLSSGMRINRGADDAAGLSISEKMRGQIRGLEQASKNSQDAISMIQTTDGALNESHAILQRMRELTVQAANDTNSNERTAIKGELDELGNTLTEIVGNTQFNGQKLLDKTAGDGAGAVTIQTGANSGENFEIDFTKVDMVTDFATAIAAIDLTDASTAGTTLDAIDVAIQSVSDSRAYLGAVQNRLDYTMNNLNASAENTQAAESRIRDVDYAEAA